MELRPGESMDGDGVISTAEAGETYQQFYGAWDGEPASIPQEGEGEAPQATRKRRSSPPPPPAEAEGPPQETMRQRLARLRAIRRPVVEVEPEPQAEPVAVRVEPPPPVKLVEGGDAETFAALVTEASAALHKAQDGVRDTDARWFVAAMAAAVAVIDGYAKRAEQIQRDHAEMLGKLMQEAEERVRMPFGPEERALLRQEFVRAGMGAVPGPEERTAFLQTMVRSVETVLQPVADKLSQPPPAPPAPVALPAPEAPPVKAVAQLSPDEVRRAAGSGAKLGVAEALGPEKMQAMIRQLCIWGAGAIAGGMALMGLLIGAILKWG
jgi:hypothetical protein